MDSQYLVHYGVAGMKWGVRHDKPKLGTSQRTQAKIDTINAKIKKHDSNFLVRNTINDFRRGRINDLKRKAAHRKAKETYKAQKAAGKSTAQSKAHLRLARMNRVAGNVAAPAIFGPNTSARGAYTRYRQQGSSSTAAALKSIGKTAVVGLAATATVRGGARIASKYLAKKIIS